MFYNNWKQNWILLQQQQQSGPCTVTFCDFLSSSFSQTLPSERWRDQLCILVCVRLPHHGADADAGLVLAAVSLHRLQVSLLTQTPKQNTQFSFDLPVCESRCTSPDKPETFSFVAAFGRRGVVGRCSQRRSERRTKWSGTSITVWDRWVTERAASWRSSSSWWRCGSHETRASWTAGPPTSSTPRPSEYQKNSIRVYVVVVVVVMLFILSHDKQG